MKGDIHMMSSKDFIKQSLELNLFFARIMKEHSFFLAAGLLNKDKTLIKQANILKENFTSLLFNTVCLSNGIIDQKEIARGDIVTDYTLNAELITEYYTGINLNTDITYVEKNLVSTHYYIDAPHLDQKVYALNQNAIILTSNIIKYKTTLLENIISCNLFSLNYPLLIEHLIDEAKLYLKLLKALQKREYIYFIQNTLQQEAFWNEIMAEHAKFIRGFLDPTEVKLIETANAFSIEFDKLTKLAQEASAKSVSEDIVTSKSIKATEEIKDFKTAATEGLINCKIKSIILPLLGDHVLREANHYLKLLNIFKKD